MKHRNLSNFSISKNIIRSVPKKKKKIIDQTEHISCQEYRSGNRAKIYNLQ